MALSNGQYAIINVTSGLALDVKGASDKSKANVIVFTYCENDTQLWHAVKKSNGWQLINSATGKSLDAASSSEGANVQQYTDNNKKGSQRWTITATGNTYELNGTSYVTYTIKKYSGSAYVTEAGTDVSSNVVVSATSQEWAFVSVPWLSEAGTYAFASALDPNVVITMESDSRQGKATLEVWDEQNRQTFQNVRWTEQGYNNLRRLETSKFMSWTSMDANIKAGRVLKQYDYDKNSTNQHYIFAQVGYTDLQGDTVPTYTIGVQSASNFVLDASNGTDDGIADYVTFQPKRTDENGDVVAAQQWVLIHASRWVKSFVVPGNIGITTDKKKSIRQASMDADGSLTAYACLVSKDTQMNARYRLIGRLKGTKDTEVGLWRSADDGSTAFNGWGDGWAKQWTGKRNTLAVFDNPITLEWGEYDRIDVDIRARTVFSRRTSSEGSLEYVRSSEGAYTVPVLWEPAITLDSAIMTYGSLHVSLKSDFNQESNRVKVTVCGATVSDVIGPTGEIEIPFSEMKSVLVPGDEAEINVSWTTLDGLTTTKTFTHTVTAEGGTVAVNPSWTYDTVTRCMTTPASNEMAAYLITTNGVGSNLYRCPEVNGIIYVPIPFGASYKIWTSVETSTDWGTVVQSFDKTDTSECVWSWGNCQETAIGFFGKSGPPKLSESYETSVTLLDVNDRPFPAPHAWGNLSVDLDFDGVCMTDGAKGCTKADFEQLLTTPRDGIYPIYRTPYGGWYKVAIQGVSFPRSDDFKVELKVSQKAVSV